MPLRQGHRPWSGREANWFSRDGSGEYASTPKHRSTTSRSMRNISCIYPAGSRRTFNMAEHSGINGRAAIMVKSKTAGKNIIVVRAMYWNNRGAGTDTVEGTGTIKERREVSRLIVPRLGA